MNTEQQLAVIAGMREEVAALLPRIAALETENKRLAAALLPFTQGTEWITKEQFDEADAALASIQKGDS